jgi:hypothetical protein
MCGAARLCASVIAVAILAVGCGDAHRSTATNSPTRSATSTTRVSAHDQAAADRAAISRFFAHLNSEFRVSPQAGYAADVATDYFVTEGLFTPSQCMKYWLQHDGGGVYFVVERAPVVSTIRATPKWRPLHGGVPAGGRIYAMTVRIRDWLPAKGSSDAITGTDALHVVVLPSGTPDLFIPCAHWKGR